MNKPVSIQNLCLFRRGDQILLAMKKRGFGAGRWNGYGGKVQQGESVEDGLVREVKEESGIELTDFNPVGFMRFENVEKFVDVYIFEATSWKGEPVETEEMAPAWFSLENIPYSEMWPSDPLWYPLYLAGKPFKGEVVFDENHSIVSSEIREV